jgi:hypothetical protein
MKTAEQKKWAQNVFSQLKSKLPLDEISNVFFHARLTYRKYLSKLLEERGIHCTAPLEGLSLGQQKAWYLKHASNLN